MRRLIPLIPSPATTPTILVMTFGAIPIRPALGLGLGSSSAPAVRRRWCVPLIPREATALTGRVDAFGAVAVVVGEFSALYGDGAGGLGGALGGGETGAAAQDESGEGDEGE